MWPPTGLWTIFLLPSVRAFGWRTAGPNEPASEPAKAEGWRRLVPAPGGPALGTTVDSTGPDALSLDQMLVSLRASPSGPGSSGDVFASLHLLKSERQQTDCLQRAAVALRVRCEGDDAEAQRDLERMNIAIALTLCDLSTAGLPAPLECSSPPSGPVSSQMACVQALSRSTQYWSTYSGYLRETNLVCLAFKQRHAESVAHDVYRNVTLEKLALLRALQAEDERRQVFDGLFTSTLNELKVDLSDLASLKGSLAAAIDALHQATSTEAVDQLSKAVTAGLQADLAARVLPGFQAGVDDALATLRSSLERLTQMNDIQAAARSQDLDAASHAFLSRLRHSTESSAETLAVAIDTAHGGVATLSRAIRLASMDLEASGDLSRGIVLDLTRSRELALAAEAASERSFSHATLLSAHLHNLTALIANQTEAVSDAMARIGMSGASWLQQCTVDCVLRVLRGLGLSLGDEQTRLEALRFVVGLVVTILGHVVQLMVAAGLCLLAWSTRRIRKVALRLSELATNTGTVEPVSLAATSSANVKRESHVVQATSTRAAASLLPPQRTHAQPSNSPRLPVVPRVSVAALQMTPLVPPPAASSGTSQPGRNSFDRTHPPVNRRVRAASAPL